MVFANYLGNIKVRHEDGQLSPNFFGEAGRNLYTA